MDKRDRSRQLTERLRRALTEAGLTVSALARDANIDRTTLAHLLNAENGRLPNGHVLAQIAQTLEVSADWLLGLSEEPGGRAQILNTGVDIRKASLSPFDEQVMVWYREAEGRKIRHVPSGIPDLMKTDTVISYEWSIAANKTQEQAIGVARLTLDYARVPETDVEMVMSHQRVRDFLNGASLWGELPIEARREQIKTMIALLEELYPTVRLYLFDERRDSSAPFTVFGAQRAAVYIGSSYFVFETRDHVRALAQRFDQLVRYASVDARDVTRWLSALLNNTVDGS